jgi:hypothetical protein
VLKITTNWFNHSFWSSPPSAIWRKRVDKNVSCLGHSLLRYDRPYSKSSLTLNEWKLNLSFSRLSLLFSSSWRASVIPYYVTMLTLQLFGNSIDTQEKLRLNFHSLSVSELLEYGRMFWNPGKFQSHTIEGICLTLNCTSPCTNPLSQLH